MKILLQCFISIESAPVFTLGLAKGLIANGVDVYALLVENIENKDEWINLLSDDKIYFVKLGISLKKHPIQVIQIRHKLYKKFKHIIFDYTIDTFPRGEGNRLNKFVKYKETMGIWHDVVPHSSTENAITIQVKETLKKMDNVVILSQQFTDIVINQLGIERKNVLHLRHGAMEYPEKSLNADYGNCKKTNYLYFGRIDGYKGLHVLAKAYKELSRKYSNITLTVAGSGDFTEYYDEYEALPNCNVVNRYLNDDDISYYFNMPNVVLVLPYIDATQSGVIGMAFHYRTPVIVSDTGGLKEQLFDGEMGLFVIPGDFQSLYNEMEKYIKNKSLIEEQRELMEIGYQKSTWEYCVKEFLEQLEIKRSI